MLSRRSFFRISASTGAGVMLAPYISGRGLEAMVAEGEGITIAPTVLRLDSNENPNGPGPAALSAITGALGEANRYPREATNGLKAAIAKSFSIAPENVVLGCGSTDILRASVYAFCDTTHGLVTCSPGFETPGVEATKLGAPIRQIAVTRDLKLDLNAMADAARGAGLVYLCNPNNPTSTVHGAAAVKAFVQRVNRESPRTAILIDEAYHEYVDDPAYTTSIPIAMTNPRVFIARTFSKVFGMAGMRVGYALGLADTMKQLGTHTLEMGVNQLAATAATMTLTDIAHIKREQQLNRSARAFTVKSLREMGYDLADTQANFLMMNLRRDAQPFRDACKMENVRVGRPFPLLDNYVRISIGTDKEMRRAVEVFRAVLGPAYPA